MTRENIQQISQGLMAHLHLNASEAAVMFEDHDAIKRLVVIVYSETASRRVPEIINWYGYPVSVVRDVIHGPH